MKTATRKPTEITQPVVFRVTDKSTGKVLGYAVKSDSTSQTYHVTYNYHARRYECDCTCGIERKHTVECKHIRAVKSIIEARKEFQPGAAQPAAPLAGYDVVAAAAQVVVAAEHAALDAAYETQAALITGRKQSAASGTCRYCGMPSRSGLCFRCAGC